MDAWLALLRTRSFGVRSLILAAALAACFALVSPVAWGLGGLRGLAASGLAAGCCLLGSWLALAVGEPFRRRRQILPAMLLGMVFRMGIPLLFGLAVHLRGGPLVHGGFLYYLVLFFEVALITEIVLSLPPPAPPGASGDADEDRQDCDSR
ncbi:MAG: hypothetical protein JW809_15785 [Pirellulales bacterium]|nr:hypothetical protein [Pirellulales bacterium]